MSQPLFDPQIQSFGAGLLALGAAVSTVELLIRKGIDKKLQEETRLDFSVPLHTGWIITLLLLLAMALGDIGTLILSGLISFLALREYVTLTPTHRADHRTLFWAFFIITPLQFALIGFHLFHLAVVMIPVYAYLFVPIRNVIAGDSRDFLARSAKIQWGLMVCVYFFSQLPALIFLRTPGQEEEGWKLLCFLVGVSLASDFLQSVIGQCFGRHKIVSTIDPTRTWEGVSGGIIGAIILGTALYQMTPFQPWQAALMALLIALMGLFGRFVMSAIKRDRGINPDDIQSSILNRIDGLCFAAPVFFHFTASFF